MCKDTDKAKTNAVSTVTNRPSANPAREPITWAYCRVSSKDQNLDRQIDAMRKYGIADEHIITDKASGKDFNRAGYLMLLELLRPGDTVCIMSIDRLGRSYEEVPLEWARITKEKGCSIVVFDQSLLSAFPGREATNTELFIQHLTLFANAFVAAEERAKIKARQREGIAAAKARGVKFGRPGKTMPANFHQICVDYGAGKISGQEGAEMCGLNRPAFYSRANKYLRERGLKKAKQ